MLYAYIADGALNAGVKVCLTFDVVSPSTGCSGVLSKATQLRCTVQIQVNYCAIIHTDSKWHTNLCQLAKYALQPGCFNVLTYRAIQQSNQILKLFSTM